MPLNLQIQVSDPPRGGGTQSPTAFEVETLQLQWSWGAQPAPAVVTYVAPDIRSQIAAGSYTRVTVLNRVFHGVCMKDTLDEASGGKTRRLEFADLRWFLNSDVAFGAFNILDTRASGGRHSDRGRHGTHAHPPRRRDRLGVLLVECHLLTAMMGIDLVS